MKGCFDDLDSLSGIIALYEKDSINILNVMNPLGCEAPPAHPHRIDACIGKGFPSCLDVRWDVFAHQGTTPDKSMVSYLDKLMNGNQATENSVFSYFDVPGKRYAVG